jgi:hypothetical protein
MDSILHLYGLKNYGNNKLSKLRFSRCLFGSEHLTKNGHTMVKTDYPGVWRKKHHVIWESTNGPVPEGHIVIFADRNKSNFNPDNLLLVSKRERVVMNQKHLIFPDADKTKVGLLVVKIIMLANERERETNKKGRGIR